MDPGENNIASTHIILTDQRGPSFQEQQRSGQQTERLMGDLPNLGVPSTPNQHRPLNPPDHTTVEIINAENDVLHHSESSLSNMGLIGDSLSLRVQSTPNQCRSLNPADHTVNDIINVENDALHHNESSFSKMERLKWTLLLSSFIVEGLSSALEQLSVQEKPIYAFMAMLMASSGLIISIIELSYRVREQNMFIWSLLGDALENFGFFGSTWQCIHSIVDYVSIKKKMNNPIKMSVLPLIFLICVAISRLYNNYCDSEEIRHDDVIKWQLELKRQLELKVELHDDKDKRKAMKRVSRLSGVASISMDMKDKKLTVIGDIDPILVVRKLRKLCRTEIISVYDNLYSYTRENEVIAQ